MTMEPATLKMVMAKIGLDEIELDRELAISLAEADRGELISAEEVEKEIREKFLNGYYSKEEARKRIKGKPKYNAETFIPLRL
jgi:predicted transcriptional regulator